MNKVNPIFSAMTDIDNSIITDAKKPRKNPKAIIIAAAVAAAAAGVVVFAGNYNPPPLTTAVADMPDPPKEIPSGTYYLDGNPENDSLYIVVSGENIRLANKDNNLRAAFEEWEIKFYDPALADDPDTLNRQVDSDMADWGADNYVYKTKRFGDREDLFMVMFVIDEDENDDRIWTGRGFKYFPEKKTLSGWAGDFVLTEYASLTE